MYQSDPDHIVSQLKTIASQAAKLKVLKKTVLELKSDFLADMERIKAQYQIESEAQKKQALVAQAQKRLAQFNKELSLIEAEL